MASHEIRLVKGSRTHQIYQLFLKKSALTSWDIKQAFTDMGHNHVAKYLSLLKNKELLLYFELSSFPGKTKQELLEFNEPLLPENQDRLKSKFSVISYLATRQNLNKLLDTMIENKRLTLKGELYYANDDLIEFKHKDLLLQIYREQASEVWLKNKVNQINALGGKELFLGYIINLMMEPVLDKWHELESKKLKQEDYDADELIKLNELQQEWETMAKDMEKLKLKAEANSLIEQAFK